MCKNCEWIPVSERLPDINTGEVLIATRTGCVEPSLPEFGTDIHGKRNGIVKFRLPCEDGYAFIPLKEVTHWMPFPEAPLPKP